VQKPIAMQRLCPRRKKLDFSLKKLTYLQEVLVIPFNPDLHVASVVSGELLMRVFVMGLTHEQ
jgi:hypothetical protein